ncbi:unnamed protein product [Diamesa hyperborea]
MDININTVFENILLSEERIAEEGYKLGFDKGVQEGNLSAYHLGFHRGAEIGAELGFYLGVLIHSNIPSPINKKVTNLISQLKSIIEAFPKLNVETLDLFDSLNTIRTQFKKLTSLLKIKVTYPEKSLLSF